MTTGLILAAAILVGVGVLALLWVLVGRDDERLFGPAGKAPPAD